MTKINIGSLFTDSWDAARSSIVNNVAGVGSRVYSFFPAGSVTYPLIVVDSPLIENDGQSFAKQNVAKFVNFTINCFSASNQNLDTISNDVLKYLHSNDTIPGASGLNALVVSAPTTTHPVINNKQVHTKTFVASYRWRGDR